MKSRKKESGEIFGLSFMDCICCGFGAVILLFVVTTREDGKIVAQTTGVYEAEVEKAKEQLEEGELNLSKLVNTIEKTEMEIVKVAGLGEKIIENVKDTEREISKKNKASAAQVKVIGKLESDLKNVEKEIAKLQPGQTKGTGKSVRPTNGTERRHYLTGLKVDGERSLILVDASLSMLDTTVRAAFSYKVKSVTEKLQSVKWLRVLDSVDWLLATMESKEYQIYLYNENVRSALPGSEGTWLKKSDWKGVQEVANCLWNFSPEGGSNLEKAFKLASQLTPKPDNVYILTDGLPNHSISFFSGTSVDTKERLQHFNSAMQHIPKLLAMPINTIMFPFLGEPDAPFAYWKLSNRTDGSFFVPAKGWPN